MLRRLGHPVLTGKKAILLLRAKFFRLKAQLMGRILSLGVSGFIMSLTNSLVQIVCNKTLLASAAICT
jgi:Na+-driven multidrug efflux pump